MIHNLWTCKWQPPSPLTPFGASLLTGLCEWPFGFSIPMAVTLLVCNGAFVGRDGVRVHNSTLRGLPTVCCANINLRLLSSTQYPSRLRTRPTVVCQSDMITSASLLFLFYFADSSSFVFFLWWFVCHHVALYLHSWGVNESNPIEHYCLHLRHASKFKQVIAR